MFTIDTSVFVADLTPSETGHADSRALLDRPRADGTPLVLPALLLVELAGALSGIWPRASAPFCVGCRRPTAAKMSMARRCCARSRRSTGC